MSNTVGFRSERGPVLIALMLSTGLVALDSTIIATAVPSIVRSIGGFAEFPWLFSIYLLAQAVSVPIYGKLSDLYGRKPLILVGIGLFLLGSILCGIAWNMLVLIIFRVIQGLGAGAVLPISITIVGDMYTLKERAKVQGYLASVWGISSVVGPTLGGVFSEYVSWRWVFLVNIPLCFLAAAMLIRNFSEQVERRRPKIDYAGAALLTSGCTLVILGLLEGGQAWAWDSAASVVVLAGGVAFLVAFAMVERRAPEPVLPLWVFSRRILLTSSLVSTAVGGVLFGLTSYVPTFVQDVLGTGPVVAGFALATLTLGWPLSAAQAGRIYLRYGFRSCALVGVTLVIIGTALLILLDASSSVLQVGATCFVIGVGMGLVSVPTVIAAQSTVGWQERGVVTGNNLFSRSMGSALGVAVFGAIANATLGPTGPATGTSTSGGHSRAALTTATQHVFIGVAGLAVLMAVAVVCLPGGRGAPDTGSLAEDSGSDAAVSQDSVSQGSISDAQSAPDVRPTSDIAPAGPG